jgi:CTP synthase
MAKKQNNTNKLPRTKFVFITGGVVSSLGKGLASASLGALLQKHGYRVRMRKMDPYLNVDPGTMSPLQHGEVFVTSDGAETDLDLGHYERFTGVDAKRGDSVTAGQIYATLLDKERRGDYLGGTVQVIPHVTDLIKSFIIKDAEDVDILLCEIGGTVGDIEGLPFFEAIRQLSNSLGKDQVVFIHLTLIPYIAAARELKTKPTQHSVKELLSIGIQPNILLCRCDRDIPEKEIHKIALLCNLKDHAIIPAIDVPSIYQAPIAYHNSGLDREVLSLLNIPYNNIDLTSWHKIVESINFPSSVVTVGIVGKYVKLKDAYKSIIESITHASIYHKVKVKINWIDSHNINDRNVANKLANLDAILVPGGFGYSGAEGMIRAIQYARENDIPFLGICFGMQLAVIEAARNLLKLERASSNEFGICEHPVIGLMVEWLKDYKIEKRNAGGYMGGTMRLGIYPCRLKHNSKVASIYDASTVNERHRHRYEVNINYKDALEEVGVEFTGISPDGNLMEVMEYPHHRWFVGVQFHPEFRSTPFAPHPLFVSFIRAALDFSDYKNKE